MGRLSDDVYEFEQQFYEIIEENKTLNLKVDELEGIVENMTEEYEALKKYVKYIESVCPEVEAAYEVANRLEE